MRLGTIAVLASAATGVSAGVVTGAGIPVAGTATYVVLTSIAVMYPAAIAVQVIAGQLLVATLLVGQGGAGALPLIPAVIGIVVSAELLAVVARLDTPLGRDARGAVTGAGRSAVLGAGAFATVALIGSLPGPSGIAAVALASGASVILAKHLMGDGSA